MRKEHTVKDRRIDQSISTDDCRGCGRINSKGFRARERTAWMDQTKGIYLGLRTWQSRFIMLSPGPGNGTNSLLVEF